MSLYDDAPLDAEYPHGTFRRACVDGLCIVPGVLAVGALVSALIWGGNGWWAMFAVALAAFVYTYGVGWADPWDSDREAHQLAAWAVLFVTAFIGGLALLFWLGWVITTAVRG